MAHESRRVFNAREQHNVHLQRKLMPCNIYTAAKCARCYLLLQLHVLPPQILLHNRVDTRHTGRRVLSRQFVKNIITITLQSKPRCGLQATRNCAEALLPVVRLTLNTERDIPWHYSQRLPYSQRPKTVAEAATCEWRLCAPAICFKRSVAGTAAPRATQVAAPTTPSLCEASNAQLNIGSAGIY